MQGVFTDERFKPTGSELPRSAGAQCQAIATQSPGSCETESQGSRAAPTQSEQINAICQAIAERLGEQRYQIWFKNSAKFTLGQPWPGQSVGYLKIGVPNLFIAGWIESHFLDQINQAVRAATGNPGSRCASSPCFRRDKPTPATAAGGRRTTDNRGWTARPNREADS
jgi:hypothetical protein